MTLIYPSFDIYLLRLDLLLEYMATKSNHFLEKKVFLFVFCEFFF